MSRLDEIQQRVRNDAGLSKLSELELESIRHEFAGIPDEYMEFLRLIGCGEVGDIRLYCGPSAASDIYPAPAGDLTTIILFGDDFQGYCFGFDTRQQFSLVEVDPRGTPRARGETSFLALIQSYLME